MSKAVPTCRALLRQAMRFPFTLARLSAGKSIAARMAMMAMTTSNSMRVNAAPRFCRTHPNTRTLTDAPLEFFISSADEVLGLGHLSASLRILRDKHLRSEEHMSE